MRLAQEISDCAIGWDRVCPGDVDDILQEESDAGPAEVPNVASTGCAKAEHISCQPIVRRVRRLQPVAHDGSAQGELFATWRHHAFITDSDLALIEADQTTPRPRHHRAATVVGLSGQHRQRRVGEHDMVAPDSEQLALGVDGDVVGVGVADAAPDQPPSPVEPWAWR